MRNNLIEVDLQSETHRVRFDSPIDSVKIDGQKLNDIHDLAVKVEHVAKNIKTLVLCLGAVLLICLICNVGMATWVASHDDEIMEAVNSTLKRNSRTMDTMGKLNNIYVRKLETMGLRYRDGKWQQFSQTEK